MYRVQLETSHLEKSSATNNENFSYSLAMYKEVTLLPIVCDYHSLLNIQLFLIRQKAIHKIASFVPQFLQKRRKKKQVKRKHQNQFMAGFVACNTKRSDI